MTILYWPVFTDYKTIFQSVEVYPACLSDLALQVHMYDNRMESRYLLLHCFFGDFG